jgi:hypothetical protein
MDFFPTNEKSIQRTHYAKSVLARRHVQVNLCRSYILVPEDFLDRTQIGAVLQQMSRKTMPQRMARHVFLDPCRLGSSLDRFIVYLAVQVMATPDLRFRIGGNLLGRKQPEPLESRSMSD